MNHWDLIDEIAASAGISPNTRRMWRERGVPYRMHVEIIDAARARGIALTADQLRQAESEPSASEVSAQ